MDLQSMIAELKKEGEKISHAIAALVGLDAKPATRKKAAAPKLKTVKAKKRGGGMTPAGRKRLSLMMKRRWEERRKQTSKES